MCHDDCEKHFPGRRRYNGILFVANSRQNPETIFFVLTFGFIVAPMRNQQVLLGFNRDPQKVQQYTCNSNDNKMADAFWGPARVMGLMAIPLTR